MTVFYSPWIFWIHGKRIESAALSCHSFHLCAGPPYLPGVCILVSCIFDGRADHWYRHNCDGSSPRPRPGHRPAHWSCTLLNLARAQLAWHHYSRALCRVQATKMPDIYLHRSAGPGSSCRSSKYKHLLLYCVWAQVLAADQHEFISPLLVAV